jgi:hypothetical protein
MCRNVFVDVIFFYHYVHAEYKQLMLPIKLKIHSVKRHDINSLAALWCTSGWLTCASTTHACHRSLFYSNCHILFQLFLSWYSLWVQSFDWFMLALLVLPSCSHQIIRASPNQVVFLVLRLERREYKSERIHKDIEIMFTTRGFSM